MNEQISTIPGTGTVQRGRLLADTVGSRAYGDVIRYQEIEQIVGEKRGTQRYYSAIAKAKRILEERGRMIRRIGGGDYQIIYPGDYALEAAREVRLAGRRIRHSGKILDAAPVNDMTEAERATHNRMRDFHAVLQARMNGACAEVKTLTAKKPSAFQQALKTGGEPTRSA